MKVVNIIPTYNEKENIGRMLDTLLEIARENPKYEFATLVVDDDSPDGTGEIVKEYTKKYKNIKLITGPKKGLGHALLRGYKYAMEKMGAEVIIPNDADMSFDPKKIPHLLAKVDQGYDVVVASRHVGEGGTKGWSLFRKLNHWVSNILFATYVAGIKEVKDHNGNFKVIRVKGVLNQVALDELLEKIKIRGFVIQPYILYELSKYTKKFTEVPVVFKFRTRGEAKIGRKYLKSYLKDVLEYMKLCILIRLERSQQFLRFCVVGGIGFVINTVVLRILVEWALWHPAYAAATGAEMAIISNFILNNFWTFAAKKIVSWRKIPFKFLQFNLTSVGAIIIQFVVVWLGVYFFGRSLYMLYFIAAVAIGLVWNYFMYTTFIWKTRKSKLFGWLQKRVK